MLNFPTPYPEELLYSTVARAGVRLGLVSPKQFLDAVFEDRKVIATLDLPNHITAVSRWLPEQFTPEQLIYNHTLFPIYVPFVPEGRRQHCLQWMFERSHGATHLALGVAASRIKQPRYIRYCPGCLKEQLAENGEYFWCREWQVAGVDACPEHGALIDTHIARPLIERHRFIAADPSHCPLYKQEAATELSERVAFQVRQLLSRSAHPSASYEQWTAYYRDLAHRVCLCRGKTQIDHAAMQERILHVWPIDWLSRHHLLPDNSDWLQTIFRKHRKSFSYLQHIAVHQSLLGAGWQIKDVLDEVCCYPAETTSSSAHVSKINMQNYGSDMEEWLELLSMHHPQEARHVSPALYGRLYRNCHDWLIEVDRQHHEEQSPPPSERVDWDKRDRELLQALQQLSAFAESNDKGPRRTQTYYLKMLGNLSSLEKNLHRLPLSKSFLVSHTETVPQYQIRRLKTTHAKLLQEFDVPPRWRVLREAHLSDERLTKEAAEYLEGLMDGAPDDQICRREQ